MPVSGSTANPTQGSPIPLQLRPQVGGYLRCLRISPIHSSCMPLQLSLSLSRVKPAPPPLMPALCCAFTSAHARSVLCLHHHRLPSCSKYLCLHGLLGTPCLLPFPPARSQELCLEGLLPDTRMAAPFLLTRPGHLSGSADCPSLSFLLLSLSPWHLQLTSYWAFCCFQCQSLPPLRSAPGSQGSHLLVPTASPALIRETQFMASE